MAENPFATAATIAAGGRASSAPLTGREAGLGAILAAAARSGMDRVQTAYFAAAAWVESSWNPRAIGDNGQSFGLFQANVNGAAARVDNPRVFLNPTYSANEAAARFAAAGVRSGAGAAATQRPANRSRYASDVDGVARQILAGTFAPYNQASRAAGGSSSPVVAARPKWSPLRDEVRAKASALGLRHTSGDRSPSSNAAAGGVSNSDHLSTKVDTWADDYVGSEAAMGELVAFALARGAKQAMVHDAGSGRHAHIAGRATAGSPSSSTSSSDDGMVRAGFLPGADDVKGAAIKVSVLVVGLALGAGLIYAGVTRITGTQGVAGQLGLMAVTKGAAK